MQRIRADDEMKDQIKEVDQKNLLQMIQKAKEEFIIQVEIVIAER